MSMRTDLRQNKVVVFDIDGTLANDHHRRHHLKKDPKDWKAYFNELPNDSPFPTVSEICRRIHHYIPVLYATTRPGEWIEETAKWLQNMALPCATIYHRATGDFRDDTIVKPELMKEIEADGYEIVMIFEDRTRAVKALRAAGYTVAQIADGEF